MNEELQKHLRNEKGLTKDEILKAREQFGSNTLYKDKKEPVIFKIIEVIKEPMFLLLLLAASVYFIVGEYIDGIIMLVFVVGICAIEFIQENRTEKALEELNKLSKVDVRVIRDGMETFVSSDEIVVGDIIILEEGDCVPADGKVIYSESLGINESLLTGESDIVYKIKKDDKNNHFKQNICYSGTSVVSGLGIIKIIAVGKNTEVGKIGTSLSQIVEEKTLLSKQINKIVFVCTIICCIVFSLTIIITFINHPDLTLSKRIVESVLCGITIAMATIPEEIPVILTVFLAMGAWDLTKEKTLTKKMKAIETLGSINVLCTDKTGTLTENKMKVIDIYENNKTLLESAYLSCPEVSYDSMDIAIKDYSKNKSKQKLNIVKEYPFTPETKMTGFLLDNHILYVKGAYENVLPLCHLKKEETNKLLTKISEYASNGYRVIAVAKSEKLKDPPKKIKDTKLAFEGLIVLYDPPRYGVCESLTLCKNAGIRVIMITGDNGNTAKGIAKKLKLSNFDEVLTGDEIEKLTDEELLEKVKTINIYARVYPNHKMRIVSALQKNGNIVAMTGDGVNDAPALKKANIGVAMGQRGTNVAKESADIVLLDDNFNTIQKAIKNGRGIYKNIKKAISYIFVIHIPIALLSLFVGLFKLPTLLLPIHVVLLELLIDPTSSIIFQRIKVDKDIMNEQPRNPNSPLLSKKRVFINVLQGILIFAVAFINYVFLIKKNVDIQTSVTITFAILVLSIMLVAFQIKDKDLTIVSFIKGFKDKVIIFVNTGILIGLLCMIYLPIFNNIANTTPIDIGAWLYIVSMSLIAVLPFDLLKRY